MDNTAHDCKRYGWLWIAPTATIIAAMMTAANLGARVTGWGFIVFTIGSIGWTIVGATSGQTNLIASNGLLTLVNGIGIWRWLGRQAVYEDGAKSATVASRRSNEPTLFSGTGIAGMPVYASDGSSLGKAVEALIECRTGTVSYIVVATSMAIGADEKLRAVSRDSVAFNCDSLTRFTWHRTSSRHWICSSPMPGPPALSL
ncbi:MAG: PRC-barrel domain-containing protein [Micavibrio sp.]|nr:PRC-barrel domain-containing protein [Micavibrio sp.]